MTEITFRPIQHWPAGWRDPDREASRISSPFRSNYGDTLRDLRAELEYRNATSCHIQVDVTTAELRLDGMLRAASKPEHPGVIVTVVTPGRTIVLHTDRFRADWRRQEDWHCNLRACYLGLVDLRRMERYGLNGGDAQYAGFAAIGPGGPQALGAGMTPDQARQILSEASGADPIELQDDVGIRVAYRVAARRLHPDSSDGDADAMARINQARQVLEAHSHG